MAHHIRYFRFSNRTQIELNEDLDINWFFEKSTTENGDENLLKISSDTGF